MEEPNVVRWPESAETKHPSTPRHPRGIRGPWKSIFFTLPHFGHMCLPPACARACTSRGLAQCWRASSVPPRPQPAIPHTAVARQAEPPAPPPAAALLPLLRLHPRSGERPQTQTPPRRHRQPRSRPRLPARTLSPRRASEARREQPRRGDEGGGRKLRAVPAYICIQAHVHVDMRARACACARAVGVPSNWSKRAHL